MDHGIEVPAGIADLGRAVVGAEAGSRARAHGARVSTRVASDAELMVLIQGSDVRAFELFYDRHVAVALRVAMRILHDDDLAEDAVQDGFIGLWRSRTSYRPQTAAASTWLLVIVSNRAIDLCRRERSRRAMLGGAPPTHSPARDCTEHEVLAHADRQELRAHLQRLPSDQRRAIELAYFGGLTHDEIARQLGLPAGTVKGRLRLGRDKLRLAIAGEPGPSLDPIQ